MEKKTLSTDQFRKVKVLATDELKKIFGGYDDGNSKCAAGKDSIDCSSEGASGGTTTDSE